MFVITVPRTVMPPDPDMEPEAFIDAALVNIAGPVIVSLEPLNDVESEPAGASRTRSPSVLRQTKLPGPADVPDAIDAAVIAP